MKNPTPLNPGDEALALEISRNRDVLSRNNLGRIRELRRYASEGYARVFDLAPLLMNQNVPGEIGYVDDPETPFGVRFIDQGWLASRENVPEPAPAANPVVEGLYLMGSAGSVGQSAGSDLDYWVCLENDFFISPGFRLFQRKLAAISEWARSEHGIEAHFYCINPDDVVRGRIIRFDDAETEGEVAPPLLLEELYRTMVVVAGRPPVWQLLPPDLDRDSAAYRRIARTIIRQSRGAYLDLGYPALPDPQQMLAAALWLAHKSEADPFKALIKLTILLEYVEKDFQCPLVCTEVKAAILGAEPGALPVDPYLVIVDRSTEFGRTSLSPVQLELLRSAAVLRVLGATADRPPPPPAEGSSKRLTLEKWRGQWGWSPEQLARLISYDKWTPRERLNLISEIQKAMVSLYIRIANHLSSNYDREELDAQKKELAPFAARLLTRHAGLETTLESLPSHRHRGILEGRLALRPEPASLLWTLHTLTREGETPGAGNLIYAARRAARVAAWLVHNQFSQNQLDGLKVMPGPGGRPAELDNLPGLLDELSAFFPPLDFDREDAEWTARAQGLVLLVINFEEGRGSDDAIVAVDFITRTGWGEMRHEHLILDPGDSRPDRYLKIAQAILKGGDVKPGNLVFHAQDGYSREARQAVVNVRGALMATLRRQAESPAAERYHRIDQGP